VIWKETSDRWVSNNQARIAAKLKDSIETTSYSNERATSSQKSLEFIARGRPRHVSIAGLIADLTGKVWLNGHYSGEIMHNLRFKRSSLCFPFHPWAQRGTKGSLFLSR